MLLGIDHAGKAEAIDVLLEADLVEEIDEDAIELVLVGGARNRAVDPGRLDRLDRIAGALRLGDPAHRLARILVGVAERVVPEPVDEIVANRPREQDRLDPGIGDMASGGAFREVGKIALADQDLAGVVAAAMPDDAGEGAGGGPPSPTMPTSAGSGQVNETPSITAPPCGSMTVSPLTTSGPASGASSTAGASSSGAGSSRSGAKCWTT